MDGPTDEREAVLGPALLALSLSAPLSPGEALRAHPQTVGGGQAGREDARGEGGPIQGFSAERDCGTDEPQK